VTLFSKFNKSHSDVRFAAPFNLLPYV
jgi:hypothetical protein